MDLPDNYFRDRSPADIIAKVATITLANISLLGSDELKRIGWLNNPIIDILYSMTSAGVWVARTNSGGSVKTADDLGAYIQYNSATPRPPTVAAAPYALTGATFQAWQRRIAQIPLTEAGGAIAATVIGTGTSGYKLHMILKKLYYPEGSTDASHTITIASEAGGGITGPTTIVQGGTAFCFTYLGAIVAGTPTDGVLVYNTTADKDITFAAADLTTDGAHHTYYLEVEYWYEV